MRALANSLLMITKGCALEIPRRRIPNPSGAVG
jgi:hypothetical protein